MSSAPIASIRDLAATARGRRLALGLSQTELAQAAAVSRSWVADFEAGNPGAELRLVLRLLDALGLSVVLDVRGEQPSGGAPDAPVDLDALLEDYREA